MTAAEIKAKWLEALRSDKYTQDIGYLRTTAGFCCLGVLCDVYDPSRWEARDNSECYLYRGSRESRPHVGFMTALLPTDIMDAIGLEQTLHSKLTAMNDVRTPFKDIANVIEERLKV